MTGSFINSVAAREASNIVAVCPVETVEDCGSSRSWQKGRSMTCRDCRGLRHSRSSQKGRSMSSVETVEDCGHSKARKAGRRVVI